MKEDLMMLFIISGLFDLGLLICIWLLGNRFKELEKKHLDKHT